MPARFPHPATAIFGVTATQSERLTKPDEEPGWVLLEWKPLPIPGPHGLILIHVALWARPKPGTYLCGQCLEHIRADHSDDLSLNVDAAEALPPDQSSAPCDECGTCVMVRHFVPARVA